MKTAKLMHGLQKQVSTEPRVRMDKVNELRAKIKSGRYDEQKRLDDILMFSDWFAKNLGIIRKAP